MQSGFNTNIRHRGVLFHVQTEDSGKANPHVITHLFHGGNIMASEKRDYSEQLAAGGNLEQVLLEVPFEQRQAVVLVDIYDLSYEEAASLLDMSLGTLKSRIHRGRERLRRLVLANPELFGEVHRLGR